MPSSILCNPHSLKRVLVETLWMPAFINPTKEGYRLANGTQAESLKW